VTESRGIGKFDHLLAAADTASPWSGPVTDRVYAPDLDLLGQMLAIPVSEDAPSQSGLYGKCLDAWFAQEFRRAGFDPDIVWPRATTPRVLPQDVGKLLKNLPRDLSNEVRTRVESMTSVAPQDANIRGRAYVKQVDVVISSWQTGPELLLSTKAQNSSFSNNLANRFEEAYGDAGNLRARYPLAAIGFAFVMRSTILDNPRLFDRAVDMMRKLRDRGDGNGYTSTCLLVTDWADDHTVTINTDAAPPDLAAGPFMANMIDVLLTSAPISDHVTARQLRDALDDHTHSTD
jgi:hypothetical protein